MTTPLLLTKGGTSNGAALPPTINLTFWTDAVALIVGRSKQIAAKTERNKNLIGQACFIVSLFSIRVITDPPVTPLTVQ
jgi:hypothetical protein